MILILFTNSYPFDYSREQTFLAREAPILAQSIDNVIIAPKLSLGERLPFPDAIKMDKSFSACYKKGTRFPRILFRAIRSPYFIKELQNKPFLLSNPVKLVRLVLFLGRALCTYDWVSKWVSAHGKNNRLMFYSYWFDDITMGLSLAKQENPNIYLISRAHGYDIYEEHYFPYYWPLRREVLAIIDKVFSASNDGREYLSNRYPEFQHKFETAHLGVNDPGFISQQSGDGALRIVSCAHIVPLKRIDLLLEGIIAAAHMRPEQKFEWSHFGDGKERSKLQQKITRLFPPNAKGIMPGYIPNANIMLHYKENPVDVFVNLSTTEGGAPVSIQEAISCGIPIIATAVGGNPEIVSERNGILLNPNLKPEDVAQALLRICDNPEKANKMRTESRKVWEEGYNAEVNFRNFAEKIKAIGETS